MFFLSFFSSLIAFLYPAYASYKVLSRSQSASERAQSLEKWSKYFCVLSLLLLCESLLPFGIIFFIPFYSTFRTVFIFYLVLPQTRGGEYIYNTFVEPLFGEHESEIDDYIERVKSRGWEKGKELFTMGWEWMMVQIGAQRSASASATTAEHLGPGIPPFPVPSSVPIQAGSGSTPHPTLAAPVPLSAPVQALSSLWNAYGPAIIASGAAVLHSVQSTSTAPPTNIPPSGPSTPEDIPRAYSSTLNLPQGARNRVPSTSTSNPTTPNPLSASYDTLSNSDYLPPPYPAPPSTTIISSESDISSNDSDDQGQSPSASNPLLARNVPSQLRPGIQPQSSSSSQRTSWFGFRSSQPGYERLKTE